MSTRRTPAPRTSTDADRRNFPPCGPTIVSTRCTLPERQGCVLGIEPTDRLVDLLQVENEQIVK